MADRRIRAALAVVAALTLSAGCAKFPDGPAGADGTRLTLTLGTDGPLRTGREPGTGGVPYVYIVAFRFSELDNPTDDGPVPVVAAPWGNGFVAGNATHYVLWDPTIANEYTVYRFADASLINSTPIGVPVAFDRVEVGDDQLRFEVTLAQMVPDPVERARLRSVQINYLTMDRIPSGGAGGKRWDALGDGRIPTEVDATITVPLTTAGRYDNARAGGLEPRGDQADPALDLVDWVVDVRR